MLRRRRMHTGWYLLMASWGYALRQPTSSKALSTAWTRSSRRKGYRCSRQVKKTSTTSVLKLKTWRKLSWVNSSLCRSVKLSAWAWPSMRPQRHTTRKLRVTRRKSTMLTRLPWSKSCNRGRLNCYLKRRRYITWKWSRRKRWFSSGRASFWSRKANIHHSSESSCKRFNSKGTTTSSSSKTALRKMRLSSA